MKRANKRSGGIAALLQIKPVCICTSNDESVNIKGPIFYHIQHIYWCVLVSELLSRYTSSGMQWLGSKLSIIFVAVLTLVLNNNEATDLWNMWPTNPIGWKLSMLVKASQWDNIKTHRTHLGHLGPLGLQLLGRHMDLLGRWASTKENLNVIQLLYLYNASCKQKPCLIHSVSYK